MATVSRVLNGKELVREETSAQVLEAARTLRYVPNLAARSLSIRRSQTIGVVLPEMHGQFFSEVIRGIDIAARREGYHVLLSGSHSDVAEMMDVVDAMRGRVDGLVVMAPDMAVDSLSDQLPLVLLNSNDRHRAAITIDNFGGARAMMDHLASLGHRRIAFITGPAQNADARERLRGYRHSMRGGNAEAVEVRGDFSEESGHAAADEIAKMHPPPTAIFAANDSMAIGALSALSEGGWSVPDDITVVGFDDIPIARYVSPQLTTIRVDIAELGRRAFAVLLDALSRPTAAGEHRRERITTNLIVRRSCAAPAPSRTGKRTKGEKS